jgi:hypothetical protein
MTNDRWYKVNREHVTIKDTYSSLMGENFGRIIAYVSDNKYIMACVCPYMNLKPTLLRVYAVQLQEIPDETHDYLNAVFPDVKKEAIQEHSPMIPPKQVEK